MKFIEQKEVLNRLINNESISNIWVLNPKAIKGSLKQIENNQGYLIFRNINKAMKIEELLDNDLVFIEMGGN